MNSIQKTQTIELINSIKDQIETLVEYEQNVPLIEVDIIKGNLRKLYEFVDKMASKSEINYVKETKVEVIDNEIEDLLAQASKEFMEEKETQILEHENVLNEQIEEEDMTPEIIDDVEEPRIEPIIEKEEEPAVVAETEKKLPKTDTHKKIVHVLDVEAEEEIEEDVSDDKSLMSEKLKKKAIKSLKQGIGINDKFMIINDLFEGRAKDYNAAIKELDNQKDQQSAIFLLEDMKDENLWESKDRAYIQFRNYIERRYM